jgi:hypothetical protein
MRPTDTHSEYYLLTDSPLLLECLQFINQYQFTHSIHLNRIRFWVPSGSLQTLMLLQFGAQAQPVV